MKLNSVFYFLPVLSLSAACAIPADQTADGEDPASTTSSELRVAGWHAGAARGGGGACSFDGDNNGVPDAFVTANGNDLSIVFTRLGELTRRGPRNKRLVSRCNFSVPIDIAPGTFLAGWSQSLQYGIIKPAGVRAGLGLDTKFTGPLGAMKFDMPAFEIEFPRNQNLNIPLAVANASRETFPENDRRYNRWKNRWCDKNRGKALEFAGTASTWSERDADNTPVVIAIDGLDVHADFGAVVQDCPTRPTP